MTLFWHIHNKVDFEANWSNPAFAAPYVTLSLKEAKSDHFDEISVFFEQEAVEDLATKLEEIICVLRNPPCRHEVKVPREKTGADDFGVVETERWLECEKCGKKFDADDELLVAVSAPVAPAED